MSWLKTIAAAAAGAVVATLVIHATSSEAGPSGKASDDDETAALARQLAKMQRELDGMERRLAGVAARPVTAQMLASDPEPAPVASPVASSLAANVPPGGDEPPSVRDDAEYEAYIQATMEDALHDGEIDREKARTATEALAEGLALPGLEQSRLEEVACATTLCRASFIHEDDEAAQRLRGPRMFGRPPLDGRSYFHYDEAEQRTVVYFVGPGMDLPALEPPNE